MAQVTVQVTGGQPVLKDADTVGELKDLMETPTHQATVNGEPVDNSYELSDYEFVTLTPKVKGA